MNAAAQADNDKVYDDWYSGAITSVGDELEAYRASLVSPSISVAVGFGGNLVWANAHGYVDIESQALATPDTIYAIDSGLFKPL